MMIFYLKVLWTIDFMRAQGWQTHQTIVYQDNKSAILLENNNNLSSNIRAKYINDRYFFVKDCIDRNELKTEFCGTEDMMADFYIKTYFKEESLMNFRSYILNLERIRPK